MTGKVDTPLTSTNVNLIKQASIDDVVEVVDTLLPSDRTEIVDGTGLNPVLSMVNSVYFSNSVIFYVPDGTCAGMAGVSDDGCVWMHCTDAVRRYPILFCKEARKWINSLPHRLLYNKADIRNTLHLKLLKKLGFKFLRLVPYGPNNIYFVEFVKLCSLH